MFQVLSKQHRDREKYKTQIQKAGDLVPGPCLTRGEFLAKYFTSLNLSYLIFKLGIIIPALPNPQYCNKIKSGNVYK